MKSMKAVPVTVVRNVQCESSTLAIRAINGQVYLKIFDCLGNLDRFPSRIKVQTVRNSVISKLRDECEDSKDRQQE